MSASEKPPVRTAKVLSEGDIGVSASAGAMVIKQCPIQRPLPCIVILVHGVNDVGEAFQNQDIGICRGLNERLNRKDLHPHSWKEKAFQIADADGNISTQTCSVEQQTCIDEVNRSPIIPFYWGYRPVNKALWEQEQKAYRDALIAKKKDIDLPYDAFKQNDPQKIRAHNNQNIDNFNNWLDPAVAKGGGTFANATTSIPDMFGPGANGAALELIGAISRSFLNDGDWSHPIYANPHRIYQAYAARRLADLILAIRGNESTKNDTINIVAHSQGTLITMLANMWVKQEGKVPADCVILNHSPYSLYNRWLENSSPGNQQTDKARQQTFANFCKLMATNPLYQPGDGPHDASYIEKLTQNICLPRATSWGNPLYNRNNFGKVYNYFCPNDGVVSMLPIQGFGWSGVPDSIRTKLGENFRQRVFCKDITVGDKTGYHFQFPSEDTTAPKVAVQQAHYRFSDVTINAAPLPAPFEFKLQGQDNPERHKKDLSIPAEPYRTTLDGNDPAIAGSAMMAQKFVTIQLPIPINPLFAYSRPKEMLNKLQLAAVSEENNIVAISGSVNDDFIATQLTVKRLMTAGELQKELDNPKNKITFSQHSSIVANPDVPANAMVFDLAIGQCNAFEIQTGKFWKRLLLMADWRQPTNPVAEVRKYYQEGILPKDIKAVMNKPEHDHGIPKGEFGVENDYGPRQRVKPGNKRDIENELVDVLQWDMPKPQV